MADDDRVDLWEALFGRALALIDSARAGGFPFDRWTFGGGTALMRRHQHRFSKDVDIFVPDPQYLGHVSPRLSDFAASMTRDYVEDTLFLKLSFKEGEIDFIASEPLTETPSTTEQILGHAVQVETSAEIIAKKLWHRGAEFKARDVLDLAMVQEREPEAFRAIGPILRDRREAVLTRIVVADRQLRTDFEQLEVMSYRRNYDECVALMRRALNRRG